MEKNLLVIGYTRKPHGLKGEIKLQVTERYLEDLLNVEFVFLNLKGQNMPFFIEDIRVGNSIIAKFEDVNSPEAALKIASKEMYIRQEDLIPDDEREMEVEIPTYERCLGYVIFNGTERIGAIEELIEYPQQEMAVVQYNNREVLVPLNAAYIQKIDDSEKMILVDLPEGLLDL
jgi:16S rRNA processing protein RimM